MSVVITNVTMGGQIADANGYADYTIRINNQPVIARFRHKRSDGLAVCLRTAANVIDIQNGVPLTSDVGGGK